MTKKPLPFVPAENPNARSVLYFERSLPTPFAETSPKLEAGPELTIELVGNEYKVTPRGAKAWFYPLAQVAFAKQ